jgi:hypothetical protein
VLNERAGERVEVDGRPCLSTKPGVGGHAVFGPYIALDPGSYRVEFSVKPLAPRDGERDPLIAVADVTAGTVVIVFDALVFRSHLEDDERYVVYFETKEPLSGVEFRLYVNGAEALLIGDEPKLEAVKGGQVRPQPPPPLALIAEHADRVRLLFFSGAAIAVRARALVVTLAGQSFVVSEPHDLRALDRLAVTGHAAPEAPQEEGSVAALVIALGMPSIFGETGYWLVGQVMNAVFGSHRRAHCANLAQLRVHWSEHKGRPLLLTANRPDTALSYLLTTSNIPMLAFFDDPADAAVMRATTENQPLADAIRFCSHSISCLGGCAGSEHVRIFDNRHYGWTLIEMVEAILDALRLEPDAALSARVARQIAASQALDAEATVEDLLRRRTGAESPASLAVRRFDAAARALIGVFAASYGPFLRGVESEVVEWPRELFYVGVNGETGGHHVDLVGSARIIFFGPYMHLPLGGWRALVQFEVTGSVSENEIEAEVWVLPAQNALATCLAKLPVQGYFQFTLVFFNADPNAVIEIRARLVKGAIEGRFALRRVTLYSVADRESLPVDAPPQRLQIMQEM